MCGIAGYLSRSGRRVPGEERLTAMRDTMAHRGPDGAGTETFEGERVGLAHRRLAVVDLSPAGLQPMPYRDRRFWLTFNGEIYNAVELRRELETRGCVFRSSCDSEVLLAAYATWGRACVDRFVGMWAFAIWDDLEKTLFCSRDRLGIKPFYYADDGDLFVFASEIRAILASGAVSPRPRPEALVAYLRAGLVDGLEGTCFRGVRRLGAGRCLRLSERGREEWRYWDLEVAGFREETPWPVLVERVRTTFSEAVRSHLVSDAPFGISLSGGLDSSSVFAVASGHTPGPIRTFTAYYDEDDEPDRQDERPYAEAVTARYPAVEHRVRPGRDGLFEALPRILWHLEEPPLAHGVYPRWHVARRAGEHVKVLLAGHGGDELLAGYGFHLDDLVRDCLLRGRLVRACREVAARRGREGKRVSAWILATVLRRKFVRGYGTGAVDASASAVGPALEGLDPRLPRRGRPGPGRSWLNERLRHDALLGLLPTLLKYEDRIDMAFSVEGRVPFLDHRFVELCFATGAGAKIREGWGKVVLRDAMEGLLPDEIVWRSDKVGYPTPYGPWFGGPLLAEAEARILDGAACREGYLDRTRIESLLGDHREGRRRLPTEIWKWLCLTLWLEGTDRLTDPAYGARRRSR